MGFSPPKVKLLVTSLGITHLERASRRATFDVGVLWQILGMMSDKFKSVAGGRRAVVTHVSDQDSLVFPHRDATHARRTIPASRTRPLLHMNLQDLQQNEVSQLEV